MKRGALAMFLALCLLAPRARAEDRHLAVVLDTSGSMAGNDKPYYTIQATKILSDLLDERDRMIAIRMPDDETCSDGPEPSLGVVFNPADRAGFKAALDVKMMVNSSTAFAGPVRTGLSFLASAPQGKRLFLIIADAGGFGTCNAALTSALLSFRNTGGTTSLVSLGTDNSDFLRNKSFSSIQAANNSRQLIDAIAAVYQNFLGSSKPQTGDVSGHVEVTIDELVSEAFLVVAADGPIGQLTSSPQNPFTGAMDLDLHGGGKTTGRDGIERAYRVVRLTNPDAGKWVFEAQGLSAPAGYLLIQDYAVELRMVSPEEVPMGRDTRVTFEVVDPKTGKRVDSPAFLNAAKITADVGGKKVELARGADGTFSAPLRFDHEGRQSIVAQLESSRVTKGGTANVTVVRPEWALVAQIVPKTEVDSPIKLAVQVEPADPGGPTPGAYPDRILVRGAVGASELTDDGQHGDERADDHLYTTGWTPTTMGAHTLTFSAVGGARSTPTSATVDVIGKLRFGEPIPIEVGPIHSRSSGTSVLSFANAEVKGEFDLRITSTFSSGGAAFEIDSGGGFQLLGTRPIALRLDGHGSKQFQVRVRTGSCPAGCKKTDPAALIVQAKGPDGSPMELTVAVKVEIVTDPWLRCYWPFLVIAGALLVGSVLVHGYWSPSRFGRQLGVKLSPEEDIEEGVFYVIRAQPGTRSGFYRDARAFISSDFRLSGSARGALARLRAQGSHVMLKRASGVPLFRQDSDGEWAEIADGESRIRFGTLYRDEKGTIFFQLRTG